MERIENIKKKARRERIKNSKYNKNYKILTEEVPVYLRGRKGKKERSIIARFRCGNQTRGNQKWRTEEEKKCRICGKEIESLEHVVKECELTKDEMMIEEFLNEGGEGNNYLSNGQNN